MKVSSGLLIVVIVAISAAGCSKEASQPTADASLPSAAVASSVAPPAPATVEAPRSQQSDAAGAAPADSTAPPIQRAGRVGVRFQDADVDHDNRLSRAEAQAMPFVAKRFETIDTDHDGFVTHRELRNARDGMRAARAAREAGSPDSPVTQK